MIHRLQQGEVPAKPHTAFYREGGLVFEHCFTRQGFDGSYSILYHPHAPHYIKTQEEMGLHPGVSEPEPHAKPLRRHFLSSQVVNRGSPFLGRELLLTNADLNIWFALADQPDPALACNADGDELIYVFEGDGQILTPFGALDYRREDYIYLPRGMAHRWLPAAPAAC